MKIILHFCLYNVYQQVLADKAIIHTKKGNCTPIEASSQYNLYTNVGTISSARPKKSITNTKAHTYTEEDVLEVLDELNDLKTCKKNNFLDLNSTSIAYIASIIEEEIFRKKDYACQLCKEIFTSNEKLNEAFTSDHHKVIACQSTFDICIKADYFLELDLLKGQFDTDLICHCIIASLNIERLYENTNFETHSHEKQSLVRNIVLAYFRHKMKLITKSIDDIKKYQDMMQKRINEADEALAVGNL